MNKNELILDRVRSLTAHDLATGQILFRLTSLEEPKLTCTSEKEEVNDAIGALITTLYRAKKAVFSATNSLVSFDLLASQYGVEKQVATAQAKINDYIYEILEVSSGKITLSQTPNRPNEIRYIYSIVDGEIATAYSAGSTASATEFSISGKQITVPTGATGKFYVEYTYDNASGIAIANKTNTFPSAVALHIYAYFKDKCNENIVYSGKIICPKAKLNSEQVELALTTSGKHPFEFNMMKDYCDEDGDLFTIIVSE